MTMLYYLSNATDNLQKESVVDFITHLPTKNDSKETIMTLAQQWINEGMEKGERLTSTRIAKRVLSKKFGEVNDFYLNRLQTSSIEELESIIDRTFTAHTIEEVFRG